MVNIGLHHAALDAATSKGLAGAAVTAEAIIDALHRWTVMSYVLGGGADVLSGRVRTWMLSSGYLQLETPCGTTGAKNCEVEV
jgi:hypothetical protein